MQDTIDSETSESPMKGQASIRPRLLLLGDNARALWHPLAPVKEQLDAMLGSAFDIFVSEDYDALASLHERDYDALLSYADCWESKLTPEQTAGLLRFVSQGGGLLVIHNGISLQVSYELAQVIGAKFIGHPPYQPLTYVRAAFDHPLLEGVSDFTVEEEPYRFELDTFTPRRILLEFDYEGARYPAAWEHPYGLGRVVYLQPGHCAASFQPASYRRLIVNSLRWVSTRLQARD
ncbi:ThuA domain-containing protein [Paenibacillus sp. R14(2021)]|uniref:ThuA domain-containing protein n=1 Tax=Paenibacillus sp. R14(2021) TaxID=2859228 RepID=UPI002157FAA2|nr:ThuA domain-containing protein [Paenibacillus sp. R14(2021)]